MCLQLAGGRCLAGQLVSMWIADTPPTKLARSGLSTIELDKKRPHVRNVELANELYRAFRVVAVRYRKYRAD